MITLRTLAERTGEGIRENRECAMRGDILGEGGGTADAQARLGKETEVENI
jgi:hypothetical protein